MLKATKLTHKNATSLAYWMLFNQEIDGIVRGTIDDFKTFEAYESLIGKTKARKMIISGVLWNQVLL